MQFFQLLISFGFFLTLCSALPYVQLDQQNVSSSVPLPPSQDPWYTAPSSYELALPGTILRIRLAPGNLTTIIANCSSTYNILYRTTNSDYAPAWAVTTLYIPASPSEYPALLSYQIGYDTDNVDLSPFYYVYSPASNYTDIPTALGNDWFVSVPDYEGPNASFANGVLEAFSTLDSIRSVLSLPSSFGIANNVRIAIWGYSAGTIGSEWAAEFHQKYAPEISFVGMALGGMISNTTATVVTVTGNYPAALFPLGLLGSTNQYPETYSYIIGQLKTSGQYNKTGFLDALNLNANEALSVYENQDIYSYFVNGDQVLQAQAVKSVLEENGVMGIHGVPQMPIFSYGTYFPPCCKKKFEA